MLQVCRASRRRSQKSHTLTLYLVAWASEGPRGESVCLGSPKGLHRGFGLWGFELRVEVSVLGDPL